MGRKLDIMVLSGVSTGDIFHFELEPAGSIVIGRAPECQLMLQDPMVSRNHAKIELREDGFFMSDLGSTHGTSHMGFPLKKGDEFARKLTGGDEFKVGEALFKVGFEDVQVKPAAAQVEADTPNPNDTIIGRLDGKLPGFMNKGPFAKPVVRYGTVASVVGLLIFLLLSGGEDSSALPKQLSAVPLSVPMEKVIGYWPGQGSQSDRSHLDKAQFQLPAADLVVEFEYRSETPVDCLIDQALIETFPVQNTDWEHRQVLVRDIHSGKERRLIFDSRDFPRKEGENGPLKRWGVRNVRVTPVTINRDEPVETLVNASLALSDRTDQVQEGLFDFIRAVQNAILRASDEANIDGISFDIPVDLPWPAMIEIQGRLRGILDERSTQITPELQKRHLDGLSKVLRDLEAELWRRVNRKMREAKFAIQSKEFIVAHDALLAVKQMFPGEDDYRWVVANRMYMDEKVIPKRVRLKPQKYRK